MSNPKQSSRAHHPLAPLRDRPLLAVAVVAAIGAFVSMSGCRFTECGPGTVEQNGEQQ